MAFGGTPVVNTIGINRYRITGATLAAATTGTISNTGGGGDIVLPATAPTIDANTEVQVIQTATAGGNDGFFIAQAAGVITIGNEDAAVAANNLEIRVSNYQSISR